MTTIRLLDARRGLNRKCEELFGNAKIAEAIYRFLCDGIEECEDAPTADVVEVVRCKDCKYFVDEGMYCESNIITQFDHFYCYYGERRTDDDRNG